MDRRLFVSCGVLASTAMRSEDLSISRRAVGVSYRFRDTTGRDVTALVDFHLTIDKGRPDALVSFCAANVKKTGPTRFEVRKASFRSDRDLSILILDPVHE
jgi:hypothetical protein